MVAATKAKAGGALMKYDEEFARIAAMLGKQEESVGASKFVSFKNGEMSYRGSPIPGNKLEIIVFDALIEQQVFLTPYDSNTPATPDCYAFSEDRTEKNLRPHAESAQPQADTCAECPHYVYGTSESGRGKKCSSVRRLSFILSNDDTAKVAGIAEAEFAFAKIPVTSVKYWGGYSKSITNTLKKPPFGVITEMSLVKDEDTQFKVQFRMVDVITDKKLHGALRDKFDEAVAGIAFPYPQMEAPAPKAKPKAKKAPQKKF